MVIPGARIYAFEPVKATFGKLVENTKGYPLVNPVNKGLYKATCSREINLFPSGEHASIFSPEGKSYTMRSKESVGFIMGDEFIRDNKIEKVDFLKLDIEGAEYDALLGFEDSLKRGLIRAVQFEYGYINIVTRKLLIDYYNTFEKYGYKIGKIFPKIVEFRAYSYDYEDFLGPNFIAVKEY